MKILGILSLVFGWTIVNVSGSCNIPQCEPKIEWEVIGECSDDCEISYRVGNYNDFFCQYRLAQKFSVEDIVGFYYKARGMPKMVETEHPVDRKRRRRKNLNRIYFLDHMIENPIRRRNNAGSLNQGSNLMSNIQVHGAKIHPIARSMESLWREPGDRGKLNMEPYRAPGVGGGDQTPPLDFGQLGLGPIGEYNQNSRWTSDAILLSTFDTMDTLKSKIHFPKLSKGSPQQVKQIVVSCGHIKSRTPLINIIDDY